MARTALVVDDSRVARMTLKKLLTANGFEVVEKNSGEEALAFLQLEAPKPNVIFMDVMMGGIDGLTATRQIKANPKLANIPVVICTGKDTEEDKNEALATGAITVLSKPPVNGVLMDVIGELAAHMVVEDVPTPAIDEAALLANVIARLEQTIIPKMQLNSRATAETISRQTAEETAKTVVAEQVIISLDAQMSAIKEQVITQAKVIIEDAVRQTVASIAPDAVAADAKQAVQRAISNADFSEQAVEAISSAGSDWLNKQEQTLLEKLEKSLNITVAQHLESTLESTVEPIVSELVSRKLAQQVVDNNNDEIIEILSKKLARLNNIVIGLTVGVITIGALTFLN